jgi:hypothetical protein
MISADAFNAHQIWKVSDVGPEVELKEFNIRLL